MQGPDLVGEAVHAGGGGWGEGVDGGPQHRHQPARSQPQGDAIQRHGQLHATGSGGVAGDRLVGPPIEPLPGWQQHLAARLGVHDRCDQQVVAQVILGLRDRVVAGVLDQLGMGHGEGPNGTGFVGLGAQGGAVDVGEESAVQAGVVDRRGEHLFVELAALIGLKIPRVALLAAADLLGRRQAGLGQPAHERLLVGSAVAIAARVGGVEGIAAGRQPQHGRHRSRQPTHVAGLVIAFAVGQQVRVQVAGPDHGGDGLIAIGARPAQNEPAGFRQVLLVDLVVGQRVAVVHGALVAAVGEAIVQAQAAKADLHIFGEVQLPALDAPLGHLGDSGAPHGVGVRMGQVDGPAPLHDAFDEGRQLHIPAVVDDLLMVGPALFGIGGRPHGHAHAQGLDLRDHLVRRRKTLGIKVEVVDVGVEGAVEPHGADGQIVGADLGHVVQHLGLILVLVAPDDGAKGPPCRQGGGAGDAGVGAGDGQGRVGREEIAAQLAGVEDRVHPLWIVLAQVKSRRPPTLHEEAPAAAADDQGDRHVHLVVAALGGEVGQHVHGAHLTAMLWPGEDLAQAVKTLAGGHGHGQVHKHGHIGTCLCGGRSAQLAVGQLQVQGEGAVGQRAQAQHPAGPGAPLFGGGLQLHQRRAGVIPCSQGGLVVRRAQQARRRGMRPAQVLDREVLQAVGSVVPVRVEGPHRAQSQLGQGQVCAQLIALAQGQGQ